jgi:hypothetical protein
VTRVLVVEPARTVIEIDLDRLVVDSFLGEEDANARTVGTAARI